MSLITYMTRIHFADRVLDDALAEEMRSLGATRPLILADADGTEGDAAGRIDDALPAGCEAIWIDDLPVPSFEPGEDGARADAVRRISSVCDAEDCDILIAYGGAAAMQAGRSLAAHRATPSRAKRLALLAVPTTATDIGIGPVHLVRTAPAARAAVPDAILCDPTLTVPVAAERTAVHGFEALSHCVEAYLGTAYNPPADGIALEGVRRAATFLERAVSDGRDMEARREILAAALNAGLASQKGRGGAEAMTDAIEAHCGLAEQHGVAHGAVLPLVVEFNARAVGERYERIAGAMGLAPDSDVPEALAELAARVGLPSRLRQLGLGEEVLPEIARYAATNPAAQTNPRLAGAAEYLELLRRAL